jgi:hypothetical protein
MGGRVRPPATSDRAVICRRRYHTVGPSWGRACVLACARATCARRVGGFRESQQNPTALPVNVPRYPALSCA